MTTTLNREPFVESARELTRWIGSLRYTIARKLFSWAVPHKHTWWAKMLGNLLSALRFLAPYTSARAIKALKRKDMPAFALWSSVSLLLFFLDAIDGPVTDLLGTKSRFGAWLDSNADKFAFLKILAQVHRELKIHEVGMEGFLSEVAVQWRQWLDYSLFAVSTEATLRRFDNKAKNAGKFKFVVDVLSLIVGFAAMIVPDRHRTKVRRLHRGLVVVAIMLALASLAARLQSRHKTATANEEVPHEYECVA